MKKIQRKTQSNFRIGYHPSAVLKMKTRDSNSMIGYVSSDSSNENRMNSNVENKHLEKLS